MLGLVFGARTQGTRRHHLRFVVEMGTGVLQQGIQDGQQLGVRRALRPRDQGHELAVSGVHLGEIEGVVLVVPGEFGEHGEIE